MLPDIYDSLQAHWKALRPGLQRVLAMQLASSAAVLDVIEAESCMAFISAAAHAKTTCECKETFYESNKGDECFNCPTVAKCSNDFCAL